MSAEAAVGVENVVSSLYISRILVFFFCEILSCRYKISVIDLGFTSESPRLNRLQLQIPWLGAVVFHLTKSEL